MHLNVGIEEESAFAQWQLDSNFAHLTQKSLLNLNDNKSQGQSLQYVGLDLRTPVFTHGQFYITISRATSINSIKAIWDPNIQNPITKNIVYSEVLI